MEAKTSLSLIEIELMGMFKKDEINQMIKDNVLKISIENGREMISADSFVELLSYLGKPIPDNLLRDVIKVVVVDDDENVGKAIRRQLELDDNIRTYVAHNGYELGRKLESVRPNVLILDYNMPGMNGLDILKGLRSAPDTKHTRVIIHSGFLTNELNRQMDHLGVSHIVEKGKDTHFLIDKVKELASKLDL